MSCEWAVKLDRFVDGELDGRELAEMEAHVKTCVHCAAEALGRLQLKRTTELAARRYTPRPDFRRKLEQSLRKTKKPWWSLRWAPAAAAVAAAGLVLIVGAFWQQHSRNEEALDELADLHVATLASGNPVDVVSTDRHTVKPWFQGRLPFSFNLPELQGSPFQLMGGRMAYFQQSPGAQLLFLVRKHEISVFIFQNRAEMMQLRSTSSLRSKSNFNCETWTEGGLRYFVVGDANAADIHALSDLLQRAARS